MTRTSSVASHAKQLPGICQLPARIFTPPMPLTLRMFVPERLQLWAQCQPPRGPGLLRFAGAAVRELGSIHQDRLHAIILTKAMRFACSARALEIRPPDGFEPRPGRQPSPNVPRSISIHRCGASQTMSGMSGTATRIFPRRERQFQKAALGGYRASRPLARCGHVTAGESATSGRLGRAT